MFSKSHIELLWQLIQINRLVNSQLILAVLDTVTEGQLNVDTHQKFTENVNYASTQETIHKAWLVVKNALEKFLFMYELTKYTWKCF